MGLISQLYILLGKFDPGLLAADHQVRQLIHFAGHGVYMFYALSIVKSAGG